VTTERRHGWESGEDDASRTRPWETETAMRLPREERQAAMLLGSLDFDADRVERLLDLEAGTVDTWLTNDDFALIAHESLERAHPIGVETIDFSKALKPKQLEAARLYYEEIMSQVATAKKVGIISVRTLQNWLDDPVFVAYGMTLRKEREFRLQEERDREETLAREALQQSGPKARAVIDHALVNNDVKVALEIMRRIWKGLEGE
jgi:hypothetical protein